MNPIINLSHLYSLSNDAFFKLMQSTTENNDQNELEMTIKDISIILHSENDKTNRDKQHQIQSVIDRCINYSIHIPNKKLAEKMCKFCEQTLPNLKNDPEQKTETETQRDSSKKAKKDLSITMPSNENIFKEIFSKCKTSDDACKLIAENGHQLSSLDFSFFKEISEKQLLRIIHACPNISSITVKYDLLSKQSLQTLFDAYPNLKKLKLENYESLWNLNVLLNCKNLEELDLSFCNRLIDIFVLKNLLQLKKLNLSSCNLTNINVLSHLDLVELNLSNNKIASIDILKSHTKMQTLDLRFCKHLENINPLKNLVNLNHLNIYKCISLTDLSPIETCVNLKTLILPNVPNLENPSFDSLVNLENLDLSFSNELVTLDVLKNLQNLTELQVSNCLELMDIRMLTKLPKLTLVILNNCHKIPALQRNAIQRVGLKIV